jgi:hypothetical protein
VLIFGFKLIVALLFPELELLEFFLGPLLASDFSLEGERPVVVLVVLDFLLDLLEEVGEDDPIAAGRGDLFLEGGDLGDFLVVLLQDLLQIVLYLMRFLEVFFILNLPHLPLVVLHLLHLRLQHCHQPPQYVLSHSTITFFLSYPTISFTHSFKSPRVLSISFLTSLLNDLNAAFLLMPTASTDLSIFR